MKTKIITWVERAVFVYIVFGMGVLVPIALFVGCTSNTQSSSSGTTYEEPDIARQVGKSKSFGDTRVRVIEVTVRGRNIPCVLWGGEYKQGAAIQCFENWTAEGAP